MVCTRKTRSSGGTTDTYQWHPFGQGGFTGRHYATHEVCRPSTLLGRSCTKHKSLDPTQCWFIGSRVLQLLIPARMRVCGSLSGQVD